MTSHAEWIKIDPQQVLQGLREAAEKVGTAQGEATVDFSAVRRIDSPAAEALDQLAGLAGERSVQVVLRGVNTDIYKVLKLLKLTERFSFRS